MQIFKSFIVLCAAAAILPAGTRAADNPAQAKAREALRQAYEQETAQPAAAPAQPTFSSKDNASIEKSREALRKKMNDLDRKNAQATGTDNSQEFSDVPAGGADTAQVEAARAALRKQMEPARKEQATTKPLSDPRGTRQYQPLESPAVPFSAEKQAKLAELLRRYQADEVTPEQYHSERAKIVAAP